MRVRDWCGHSIRFVEYHGEWWAVLKDVCDALKLNTWDVSQRIDASMIQKVIVCGLDTNRVTSKVRKVQKMLIVNEIGIYEALFAKGGRRVAFPAIKTVHFSGPCTVVLWTDGTKTIVRCDEGDVFDPEKGLAMAIAKKALGNKGSYYETFKRWIPAEEGTPENTSNPFDPVMKSIAAAFLDSKYGVKGIVPADRETDPDTNKAMYGCRYCARFAQSPFYGVCYECLQTRDRVNFEDAGRDMGLDIKIETLGDGN